MEPEQTNSKPTVKLERIIGIILLIPPIIGTFLFVLYLCSTFPISTTSHLGGALVGRFYGGQPTSTAPIYLGLMAIAGAILLRGTDKK